jgi:hypothetical protein
MANRVEVEPKVRITRQLRERCNVKYELDLEGTPLALRMFPTDDGAGEATWRVEATSSHASRTVISASASTRFAALEEVGRSWRRQESKLNLPAVDWTALLNFLSAQRAL